MAFFKPLFLILFTLLLNLNSDATEIIGGSLRYEALGNQKYKVIGVINRNCSGPAMGLLTFKVYSGTTSYTLTANRVSIKDITLVCPSSTLPCNPANTPASDGQEQHTFESVVDFSKAPYNVFYNTGQCEVMFSMESCCRSSNTTNITANNFYLEAMLNLCVLGTSLENSSTERNPPSYTGMCVNLPFVYSFGYFEKDGDSLLHTVEIPKKSKDSFERFIGPLSVNYPMTPYCSPPGTVSCNPLPNAKPPRGFYFDNNTGDIIVTPIDINERAIIDIRTTEYRVINNAITMVGYSTTELFIKIKQCSDNNPPTIPTANKYSVCEGNKLCFTIQSRDIRTINATTDDTTYLTWNHGIPATTCTFTIIDPTAREKAAQFCWQTKVGDAKPYEYQFSVTATDSNCEQPLITTKAFNIMVKGQAKTTRIYNQPVCGKLIFNGIPKDTVNFKGVYAYDWSIRDSSNSGTPLYRTFKQQDSFVFTKKGQYIITETSNNPPLNCPLTYMDTVQIKCIGGGPTKLPKTQVGELVIYPNPTNGFITIDLNKNIQWIEMKLSNSMGQVVYSGPATSIFDMSGYPAGYYIIELVNTEGKILKSVIKE